MLVEFDKQSRHSAEFLKIKPTLFTIVCYGIGYINHVYKKVPLITSILRTESEQRKIRKDLGLKYIPSVHESWRGLDMVVPEFTLRQYKAVADHISRKFPYGDGKHKSCLLHGTKKSEYGRHFHFQISYLPELQEAIYNS